MIRLSPSLVAQTVSLALAFAAPALAQTPAPIAPRGSEIGIDDARRIANENGLVRVHQIELDDGVWEIEGMDAANAKIEIDIRAVDGAVVKIDRDRPASAATRP